LSTRKTLKITSFSGLLPRRHRVCRKRGSGAG
jgi:hypothetical protein